MGHTVSLFQKVAVRDYRHKTNHYMVLGYLHGVTLREHQRYLGLLTRIPLYPSKQPSLECYLFASIRQAVPRKLARARLLYFRGYMDSHQHQGIPPKIPGQEPTSPSQPRFLSAVTSEWVLVQKSDGYKNCGGKPPRILPPPNKGFMVLDSGVI